MSERDLQRQIDDLSLRLAEQTNWNRSTRTAIAAIGAYLERIKRPEDPSFLDLFDNFIAPRDGMATNSSTDADRDIARALSKEAASIQRSESFR